MAPASKGALLNIHYYYYYYYEACFLLQKVKGYNAVTALYNLTDHVPMYMSIDISSHVDLHEAFVD